MGIAFEKRNTASGPQGQNASFSSYAFEVSGSQLADEDGDAVLRQIHAIRNWI